MKLVHFLRAWQLYYSREWVKWIGYKCGNKYVEFLSQSTADQLRSCFFGLAERAERLRANNWCHVARRDAISTERCCWQARDRTNPATSAAVAGLRRTTHSGVLDRKIFNCQRRRHRRLLFKGMRVRLEGIFVARCTSWKHGKCYRNSARSSVSVAILGLCDYSCKFPEVPWRRTTRGWFVQLPSSTYIVLSLNNCQCHTYVYSL